MGANFDYRMYPGDLTRDEVKRCFVSDQEQCRYENGHMYSGGIGMADGIEFPGIGPFLTDNGANEYLFEHCQKWKAALAVKIERPDGTSRWLVGALCAS